MALLLIGKAVLSLLLAALLVVGIFNANPRFHQSKIRPMAQYMTGFLLTTAATAGLYYLWF